MNNIPGVAKADGPYGEVDMSAPPVQEAGYFINTVPADVLDKARAAAREAAYPNSEVERRTILAVDDEVWDRVRHAEQHVFIPTAEKQLAQGKAHVETAETALSDLEAIRDDLRRGNDITELSTRYIQLRRRVEKLRTTQQSYSRSAEVAGAKVADPLAAVQKVLSAMPQSTFNPINVSPRFR